MSEYVTHTTHPKEIENAELELIQHAADLITEDVQSVSHRWKCAGAEIIATRDVRYSALAASHKELVEALKEIKKSLSSASNDGQIPYVKEANANHSWWVANEALAHAAKLTKQ